MQKNVAMPQVYTLAQREHFGLALQSVICFSSSQNAGGSISARCSRYHLCMPVVLSTDHKDDQDDRQKQLLETVTRVE